jgi:hypothetical protein
MKKILVCLVVAGVLVSVSAMAGKHSNVPVYIWGDSNSGGAWGALGSAYNSSDSNQFIGCQIDSAPGVSVVTCTARAYGGPTASCRSTDAAIVATARAINSDSHIIFWWVEAGGNCRGLIVTNSSEYPPKRP